MNLLQILFGCQHKRCSFPMTRKGRTYVVCLCCGAEMDYDWNEMKVIAPTHEVGRREEVVA